MLLMLWIVNSFILLFVSYSNSVLLSLWSLEQFRFVLFAFQLVNSQL